jgi:hypothetical protein
MLLTHSGKGYFMQILYFFSAAQPGEHTFTFFWGRCWGWGIKHIDRAASSWSPGGHIKMIDDEPTAASIDAARFYLSIANGAVEKQDGGPRRWKGRAALVVVAVAGAMALSSFSPLRPTGFPNLLPVSVAIAFACGFGGNAAGWLTVAAGCLWGACLATPAEFIDPHYFPWFAEVGLTWASIPAVAGSYGGWRRRRRRTKPSIIAKVRSSSVIGRPSRSPFKRAYVRPAM